MTLPSRRHLMFFLLSLLSFLSACAAVRHDATLDQNFLSHDLTSAEGLAQHTGQKDLDCSSLTTEKLAAKNAEGAPMGPIWSNYLIRVSGCGKDKTYKIQCEGEYACFLAK